MTVEGPARMHLRLCGDPALLTPDGERVPLGRKTFALLAYLALEPGMHSRHRLAALLWPEADEARASMSLRQALAKLKAVLGEQLHSDRQQVWLPADVSAWRCDVTDFLSTLERDPVIATSLDVRGFLDPVPIDDAPEFAHWTDRTRETLARKATGALRQAARDAAGRREWTRAGLVAERWVAIDAMSEEGVSVAVEAAFMRRDPERGRALYKSYEATLRGADEGGGAVVPGGIAALLRRLESVTAMTPAHGVPTVRHDTLPRPSSATPFTAALHGRDDAWGIVSAEWAHVSNFGTAAVVFAQGPSGSGRSRLLVDAAAWTSSRGATVLSAPSRGKPMTLPYLTITALLQGALDAPGLGGIDERHLVTLNQLQPEIVTRFPGIRRAVSSANSAGADVEPAFPLRVYEALAQLAGALSEDAPLVIVLDDLPWCDRESAMLLQMVLQRCEGMPVLWLASAPTDETSEHPHGLLEDVTQRAAPIALPALDTGHIAEMLQEFSGEATGWELLASRVHAVSHGLPSLVCSTVDTLRVKTGDAWDALRVAEPTVPRPHARVRARIDALSDMAREMLLGLAIAMPDATSLSCDAWHAQAPVPLQMLSHLHGISRLRAARTGTGLADAHLVLESAGGFRAASPSIANYARSAGSASITDVLRRRLAKLQSVPAPID